MSLSPDDVKRIARLARIETSDAEAQLGKLDVASKRARYAGRPATASTAAGLMSKHVKELEHLLEDALG